MSPARWTSPSSNPSSRSRSAQIRSTAWSTATWVGERNSTRRPCRTHPSTIRPTTSVLPVPGGPQMNVMSQARARSMASRWRSLSARSRYPVDEPLDVGPPGHARCTVAENEARGGEVHPTRATRGGDPFSELLRRDGSVLAQLRVSRLAAEVSRGRDANLAVRQDRSRRPLPSAPCGGRTDQGPSSDVRLRPSLEDVLEVVPVRTGPGALAERDHIRGRSHEDRLDLKVDGSEERVRRLCPAARSDSPAPLLCRRIRPGSSTHPGHTHHNRHSGGRGSSRRSRPPVIR